MVKELKADDWILKENQFTQTIKWADGVNWFHIYQRAYNLCWVASASSVFHWWYEVNKKYIEAYYNSKEGQITNKPDMSFNPIGERKHIQSKIFELFTKGDVWPNSGNKPSVVFIWIVNGIADKDGGGYFREVFTDSTTSLASTNESISKGNFNEMMTNVFKNKKGVVSIGTITSGPHAITACGVSYDDEGYINGIYTSDSAYNGKTIVDNVWGGLDYDKVIYSSSKPYIQNKAGSNFPINRVYILYQNEERWQEYLKSHNIEYEK